MSVHAQQQLKHLSEISTMLARVDSIDRTLPAILSLMTHTLPVRGATLISHRKGRMRTTGWKTEDTSAARSHLDELHARAAYGYLTGTPLQEEERAQPAAVAGRAAPSSKDLQASIGIDERNAFVVLPLVVEGGPIFGALQVEGEDGLDEGDLLFVNAVVGQLALAIDREAVLASRDALANASRLHAAERIAELQRTEREQHFLADVGSLLAASLDYRDTLATIVRMAVPFLADVCFVDEVGARDEVEPIVATRIDAATAGSKLLSMNSSDAQANEISADAPLCFRQPQDEVLATGKSIALPNPSVASNDDQGRYARSMAEAGFGSIMVVPLIARGETLGALTFASRGSTRRYSASDLELAEEVARRAALAVDHARLLRQAERAVQARENILHIVSHDLRSPLNALSVSGTLLSEELAEVPAEARSDTSTKALDLIQRSVKRMQRMVGDLLDTASIDAGRLAIVKARQVIQALVEEAIEANKSAASRRSIALQARLPEQAIHVDCDRGRILQVLSNLIGNAIKFTPGDGTIVVSVERRDNVIRVAVSDTGAGIERTQLPYVFDRHFQAKSATSIGTGLGLYISKGIIHSHGGKLWVESELDHGTTFAFTLKGS
jgi:signal transduction histidine kinase